MREGMVRAHAVAAGLLASCLLGAGPGLAETPRSRPVLILPFQNTAPGEADPWFGEGVAETLYLAVQVTPTLLPLERGRVLQTARAAGVDLSAPLERQLAGLGRTLRVELVLTGEYQLSPDGALSLTPRVLDARGVERQALESLTGGPGRALETQAELGPAYLRALRLPVKADEVQRMQAVARPTTSLAAFEAFARGRRAYLRGGQEGYETAVELYSRAVELDPSFALAHFHLGLTHLALGNRWKATAQFRAATQIDPTLPEPFKAIGDIFLLSPRRLYDQAIEGYNRALALRPHYADAHVGLGDAKAAKGDHEGAIQHYQRALALDPLNARVHVSLAKIYYNEKGLYYEAVQAYKRAVELDPAFLEARMGLGEVYEEKGLYQDAIAEYRKVIELDPRHTGAHYNLAMALEKVDVKEAIAQWERYIGLAAQIPSEKDWVDIARQHLRKLRERRP